jgi:predicted metal-dependent enzyme (double-stranded beta helix superfamily)
VNTFDRRQLLTFSIGAFLQLRQNLRAVCADVPRTSGKTIDFDAFLEQMDKMARSQYQLPWHEEEYVKSVEKLVSALRLDDSHLARELARNTRYPLKGPQMSFLEQRVSFQISLITLNQGQIIPLHDHPDMTGVMTCIVGKLDTARFDFVSHLTPARSLIRSLGSIPIAPGEIASLTSRRSNIHSVRAQQFSQIIDIFTPPYDESRIARTNWYAIKGTPPLGETAVASVVKL